jgi:CheY-like chemotaxis protein
MPGVDGFEATRAIRHLEREGPQPSPSASKSRTLPWEPGPAHRALIIALTGLASAKDQDEAYQAGVDVFLTKPARFGKLAEFLAQWEQGDLVGGGKGDGQIS